MKTIIITIDSHSSEKEKFCFSGCENLFKKYVAN
jgi:hypothetical protein